MSDTEEKIVRYVPGPLSEEQIAELKALSEMPDSEIDFSDIPELDDAFFKNAEQGAMYRLHKQQTTIRLDAGSDAAQKARAILPSAKSNIRFPSEDWR